MAFLFKVVCGQLAKSFAIVAKEFVNARGWPRKGKKRLKRFISLDVLCEVVSDNRDLVVVATLRWEAGVDPPAEWEAGGFELLARAK